ncbi:MAG: hypothetical protein WCH57_08850 [Verrucomicrobiota bacterium]
MRSHRVSAKVFSVLVVVLIAVLVALIFAVQDKMIYHPRPYRDAQLTQFIGNKERVQALSYSTSQGPQQCYYVPPRSNSGGRLPASLWVFFTGNGGLALDWMCLVKGYPSPEDAFLLIEYPGYGNCAGHPSSKHIQQSANAALTTLAAHLGTTIAELEPRLKILGYSLGAATALAFASDHPVSRVVLVAPFSSLQDMARLRVGWPLCYLLRDRFDNRARIREITTRASSPSIEILLGTQDEMIPFTMGRELAGISPAVHFQAVNGVGHNDILGQEDRIYAAMGATGLSAGKQTSIPTSPRQ